MGWLGWLGVAGQRAQAESREQRQREEEKENIATLTHVLEGKWFTEIFSVNRFPYFTKPFSGQKKKISVDFPFYRVPNIQTD